MRTAWKAAIGGAAALAALLGVLLWKPGVRVGRPATAAPGPYSLQQLRQLPEEHLFYPGAEVVERLGQEGGPALPGRRRTAYSGYRLGAQATPPEIEAFYRQRLQELGYGPVVREGLTVIARSTSEERATGWRKGDLIFRLAILKKDHPLSPPDEVTRKYTTIYEIAIIPEP